MENPVVKGWDRSLDLIRCNGRFILEVPPGSERAFGGESRLEANIEYTAQASADGAGFVYQQKGAEPIVAKLATFNLSAVAYRPPPAIDPYDASSPRLQRTSVSEQPAPDGSPGAMPNRSSRAVEQRPERSAPPMRDRYATARPVSSGPALRSPNLASAPMGEATVRTFYKALRTGNGAAASLEVIPEKRSRGAFSPAAMSRFYGRLPEPIALTSLTGLAGGAYRVTYRYSAGRSRCNGSAIVTLASRGGREFIRSIQSLTGC